MMGYREGVLLVDLKGVRRGGMSGVVSTNGRTSIGTRCRGADGGKLVTRLTLSGSANQYCVVAR